VNLVRHALVFFVVCKCGSTGNMFPFIDGKGHRQLKERMMAKGNEGRTRAKALDQRRGRAEVFVMDFFCSEITQNVSFFCLEHGGKKAEICGDR